MKKIDMLLVNSFAPRQRIVSDAALENSLAILRTYLEDRDYCVEVVDDQRVTAVEKGVPRWCLHLLRLLTGLQLNSHSRGLQLVTLLLIWLAWPFHAYSLFCRRRYMDEVIDGIVKTITTNNVPFLGIKVWYGDAFVWSKKLASRVKIECPETVIIAGGPQVKVYGEAMTVTNDFDIAIMGPGEEILENLLTLRKKIFAKHDFLTNFFANVNSAPLIKTAGYRESSNLKDKHIGANITIPRYRAIDMNDKILFHTLPDGVGCTWNKCNFCSHTRYRLPYQARNVDEIIDEIKTMTKQGIAFFRFSSSETPIIHGKAIAEAILEHDLHINYSMFIRPGIMNEASYHAYSLMIKSGLRAVFMGGETGHDQINNKVINKGIGKKQMIDTINCIRLASNEVGKNCRIGLSLIYPCPVIEGVTLEDVYKETISLITQTLPDTVIVNPPGVFPDTQWFKEADKFGFKIGSDFINTLMQYEYSIYKPAEFWTPLNFSLQGLESRQLLGETGRLRKAVADMGIPTDISDEYLMMTEAIGYNTRLDLLNFKRDSLLDIISGSSHYSKKIVEKINKKSHWLAMQNSD